MNRGVACLSLLVTLLFATRLVNAAQPTDFRFLAPINSEAPAQEPVRFTLPQAVISETSNNFADVRIFDGEGLETPYLISEQREAPRTSFTFIVLSYNHTDDVEEIVLERPQDTAPIQELVFFTSARDFKKSVQILESEDLISWRDLATDVIFDFSSHIDLRRTKAALPDTNARYLKLFFRTDTSPQTDSSEARLYYNGVEVFLQGHRAKPVRMDRIEGHTNALPETFLPYDRAVFTHPRMTTDEDKNTIIHLGRVNLPINEIVLPAKNPYYHRRVELWAAESDDEEEYRFLASGAVYKIPGMTKPENTLQVHQPQREYLRLKIINGDNPPLRLQHVEVAWGRRNLYFIPEVDRRYQLYFGNARVAAPHYELKHILPADSRTLSRYAEASLGEIRGNPDYRPTPDQSAWEKFERMIFISVVVLLTCGLGLWLYRLLSKIPLQPSS